MMFFGWGNKDAAGADAEQLPSNSVSPSKSDSVSPSKSDKTSDAETPIERLSDDEEGPSSLPGSSSIAVRRGDPPVPLSAQPLVGQQLFTVEEEDVEHNNIHPIHQTRDAVHASSDEDRRPNYGATPPRPANSDYFLGPDSCSPIEKTSETETPSCNHSLDTSLPPGSPGTSGLLRDSPSSGGGDLRSPPGLEVCGRGPGGVYTPHRQSKNVVDIELTVEGSSRTCQSTPEQLRGGAGASGAVGSLSPSGITEASLHSATKPKLTTTPSTASPKDRDHSMTGQQVMDISLRQSHPKM